MSSKSLPALVCTLLVCMHPILTLALWDFAVTTNSKILFFNEHWGEITSSAHQFDQLSALAFDETEEIVYFNDQQHNNGSIFSLKIPTTQEDPHIIERVVQRTQNETIMSIAFDPLNRNLFWADSLNKKIYFISVDVTQKSAQPKVLLDLSEEESVPDGIAIDICRRKLYWTNANFKNATIERIDLDGSQREVIVSSHLYLPHGIVVDQLSDRIYWVVDQQGVHFSVESANLDGSERVVIVKGLNNVPLNLAVTKDGIFWTDTTHNAVWSHSKFNVVKPNATEEERNAEVKPHKVLGFAETPRSIVARTQFLTKLQDDEHCANVVSKIKSRLLTPKPTRSPIEEQEARLRREYCLNGGEYSEQSGMCICKIGYNGARCDLGECHNFCVHGTCSMSSMGFPTCTCPKGFYGERCQSFKCSGYCLNGGACKIDSSTEPTCECKENYSGLRCEQNSTEICALFCRLLKHEPDMYVPFGCHDICEELTVQSENGADLYAIPNYRHLEVCKNAFVWNNTLIIVLVCGVVLCLSLVLLIVHGLRRFYKPARPRIKKTFVVRKQARSETPLTNRPLATEQCEITIENCCNMNICETPCFDPKLVQQTLSRDSNTKEDKKMLITNMEDELY